MWRGRLGFAVAIVAFIASTTAVAGIQSTAEAAPAHSAKSLDVVSAPIAVGSTAVVISVDRSHALHLDGIDPVTNSVLWQRPYSASAVTPGVALAPAAIGDTVIDLVPFSKPSNPAVYVAGIKASTGSVEWQGSAGVVLSDNPASCASNQDFCLTGFNPDGSTSLVLISAAGQPKGVISGPGRAIAPDLYQSDDTVPTFQQLSASGTIAWTKSVAAIFGPGYDPSTGWNISPVGNLNVGSVAPVISDGSFNFGAEKTLGFDFATGSPQWSLPGAYQCLGPLVFLSTEVTCQYTGTIHYAKGSTKLPSLTGVTLTLAGFNPSSGVVNWTLPVSNVASLTFGNNLSFVDGTRMVVLDKKTGKVVVLDTSTGTTAPLKGSQILWCEKTPTFNVVAVKGSPGRGKHASAPVYHPCTTSGRPTAKLPSGFPDSVGATVNGVFVWPSPQGLLTHVTGEPSTSA
jgi:hypothetical protein